MNEINISLQAGDYKRLLTKGKYCDSDILLQVAEAPLVNTEGTAIPAGEEFISTLIVLLKKLTLYYLN